MQIKMYRLAEDAVTEASTDIELAREFIAHGELRAKSIQNSQKELFRFLTCCREAEKKTLVQLNVADLNNYKEFLKGHESVTFEDGTHAHLARDEPRQRNCPDRPPSRPQQHIVEQFGTVCRNQA